MGKYSDMLLGGPEMAQQARPAPTSDSGEAAGYGTTAAASYMDDPLVRARFFAQRRGIPLSRYRIVEGRPVYRGDDGQEYFEEPDFAPLSDPGSIVTSAASLAGPTTAAGPPLATGIVTAPMALAGPGGLAASMGLTGAAGALGQGIKERIGNAAAGETQPGAGPRAIQAGVANMLGQGVGTGINAFVGRMVPRDIARLNPSEAQALQAKATKEGIPLTPAEITNLESLKGTQRVLTNMPASAGQMRDFYASRAANVENRIQGLLDEVGAQDSGELAGRNLKEWALTALQGAKNERQSAAEPFYQTATAEGGVRVDPSALIQRIDGLLSTAKGATKDALTRARGFLFANQQSAAPRPFPLQETPPTPETSVRGLHAAKLAIDDLISGVDPKGPKAGAGGTDSTTFAQLTSVKEELTKLLTDSSRTYRTAEEVYRRASAPLNQMQSSLIGVLSRTDDQYAQQALLNMFNPGTSGPKAVFNARSVFERMGPEGQTAWQDAKRIFLQNAWDKASREFKSTAQAPNLTAGAGFRAALFGDKAQRDMLKAAFTKDEYNTLSDLGDVLEATNRVRLTGSETAWNLAALKETRDAARPLVAKIVSSLNPAQMLRAFDETVTNYFFQNDLEGLAKVYTSPGAMTELRNLRLQKPGSQRWVAGLAQFAATQGDAFVDRMLARSYEEVPPAPGQTPSPAAALPAPQAPSRRQSYSERLGLQP